MISDNETLEYNHSINNPGHNARHTSQRNHCPPGKFYYTWEEGICINIVTMFLHGFNKAPNLSISMTPEPEFYH